MKYLKQIIISALVIIVFIAYAVYYRTNNASTAYVAPTPTPTSTDNGQTVGTTGPTPTPTPTSQYKDGTYTGKVADAYFGNLQVKAIVTGGKLADVQFLQYPNDNTESKQINTRSNALLKTEAIQSQSAQVNVVSGATQSSQAFVESLKSALSQAVNA